MSNRKDVLRRAARTAARKRGIDPDNFETQLGVESNYDEDAVSPMGARGVAQFMPGTAKGVGVDLNDGRALDDINGAAELMAKYLREYKGDWRKALAAYNAGPGAVGGKLPEETIDYIAKVLGQGGDDKQASPKKGAAEGKSTTRVSYDGDKTTTDTNGALIDALLSGKDAKHLLQNVVAALDAGAYTTTTPGKGWTATTTTAKEGVGVAPSKGGSGKFSVREEFWNGPGAINVDDNKRVAKGYVSGHTDHVHVAVDSDAARKRVVAMARKHGLTITSEGNGKHATGSYHYRKTKGGKSRAIDVAGDPKQMAAFAREVAAARKG